MDETIEDGEPEAAIVPKKRQVEIEEKIEIERQMKRKR